MRIKAFNLTEGSMSTDFINWVTGIVRQHLLGTGVLCWEQRAWLGLLLLAGTFQPCHPPRAKGGDPQTLQKRAVH